MSGMRYQPQGLAVLDRSNPLTVGLASVMTGSMVTLKGVGRQGIHMARASSGGYEDPVISRLTNPLVNLDGFTFSSVIRCLGLNGSRYAMRIRNRGNVNDTAFQFLGCNGSAIVFKYPGGQISFSYPFKGDVDLLLVATWDRIENLARLFVNGVLVVSGEVGTGTLPTSAGTGNGMFHADVAGAGTNLTFLPYLNIVHTRALSVDEAVEFSKSPWQIFAEPEVAYYEDSVTALVRRLYMSQGYYTETPPLPGSKPLVMVNGVLREREASEGKLISLNNGIITTVNE